MASDLVTTGARRASEGIQAVKEGLPVGNQVDRTFCSKLQGLIQRVSTAEQGRTLAERQVKELRGHLAKVEGDAAEGREAARQLELQLGRVQDLADVRVREAESRAKEKVTSEKAFATLQAREAQKPDHFNAHVKMVVTKITHLQLQIPPSTPKNPFAKILPFLKISPQKKSSYVRCTTNPFTSK